MYRKLVYKTNVLPTLSSYHGTVNLHFFVYFFGGLERVGHSFAYVAHFIFLGDVWIRTQRAAVASRCATNLATFEHFNASYKMGRRGWQIILENDLCTVIFH